MIGTIVLCTVTVVLVGVAADVLITTRRVERSRPPLASYGEAFGDVPAVPNDLFHNGTFTTRRRNDHVSR